MALFCPKPQGRVDSAIVAVLAVLGALTLLFTLVASRAPETETERVPPAAPILLTGVVGACTAPGCCVTGGAGSMTIRAGTGASR